MRNKGLLEIIQNCLGLEYISDLKGCKKYKQIAAIVELIPAERFELREWTDAVSYLVGEQIGFEISVEAREYLIDLKANYMC